MRGCGAAIHGVFIGRRKSRPLRATSATS